MVTIAVDFDEDKNLDTDTAGRIVKDFVDNSTSLEWENNTERNSIEVYHSTGGAPPRVVVTVYSVSDDDSLTQFRRFWGETREIDNVMRID